MTFRRFAARTAFLLLALFACVLAQAQTARTPPAMRLGDAVKPLAYELSLTLDPKQPGFTGRVEIDVELARATDFFWMNGKGVDVRSAVLVAGTTRHEARASRAGDEFIGLDFGQPVAAGRGRLVIEFAGRYSSNETRGLFHQQDLGEWYAFTQFESTNARRAFPCFDEPHWKTPWTVALTVRREHTAVANAPMQSERDVGGGMKEVRFAPTQPIPSYLVAFGVGPFDVVDGGTAGMKKTPLRYIVPKGRAADTRFAVQSTPKLLELLEEYFGSPYPFDKLDSLAIPITVAFGAMENPGLITYRSQLLLSRNGMDDVPYQQVYSGVAAHEIAHQWFGDLVTMKWWDDIWLNESFATWMAGKVVRRYNPAWESQSYRERQRQSAFATDRLSSSRQVRQPVNTRDDLANVYDRITYDKGGAVLDMFEAKLGEAAFREGVRRYIRRHAWGNASAEDFFAALGEADRSLVPSFSGFVLQPGLPLVDFELDCSGAKPAVKLRQQRFLPATSAPAPQQWLVPACMRVEGVDAPACTTLQEREQRLVLDAPRCPAWLLPNPGGTGYFVSRLDAKSARALGTIPLREVEAIALIGEQAMLTGSGAQPMQPLLDLVASLSRDARPEVVASAAYAVWDSNTEMLDEATRKRLPAWVREHFGARAAQLGWVPREGESDAVRKLRNVVVPMVARMGEDAALRAEARKLALDWAGGDRRTLGAGYRAVLRTAAWDADSTLFDAYVEAAQKATDPRTRVDLYKALGHARDAVLLRRAFDFAISGKADVREAMEIYDVASEDPQNAPALLAWMREHFDALAARLPEETLSRMPRKHMLLCTPAERDAVRALYAGPRGMRSGLQRNLAQALETIDICIKARELNAAR